MRILTLLAEVASAPAALEGALSAARALRGGASMEAVHVVVDPRAVSTSEEEVAVQQLREADQGDVHARAKAMRTRFVSWVAGLPEDAPRIAWREIAGDETPAIIAEAKEADLLVLARPNEMDGYDALHAALFDTGRPLLIVPSDWRAGTAFPGAVLIAWDGAQEVARAIDGAMPWLHAASSVTVMTIGDGAADALPAVSRLRAASIDAQSTILEKAADGVAATLLRDARVRGVGLLVAGASRRNRVVEWLFGGVTRELLDHAPVPVFFSH